MSDILTQVIDVVSSKLDVEKSKVTPSSRFIDDLGADSLDVVEMVMELEEKFSVTISDSAAEKLKTIEDVVTYVKENSKVN